jgi:hypothetical protein
LEILMRALLRSLLALVTLGMIQLGCNGSKTDSSDDGAKIDRSKAPSWVTLLVPGMT